MEDLSLHLMDIAQNSVAAGADHITLIIKTEGNPCKLICEIVDNGRGMDADFLKKVTDPFKTSRTTRKVGLGLPLLKQSAEMAGGTLSIESEPFKGTKVRAVFCVDHMDRIPLGDVSGTIRMLITANPEKTWIIQFVSSKDVFSLNTDDIKLQLGGVPIDHCEVGKWIEDYMNEGIKKVFGGVLDEILRGIEGNS
ncbi:MAG TPA: ATP-binding protein [Ruminiclostridium sp.]|nr:ATP-binding protein [Ruminiclostridium sp.]